MVHRIPIASAIAWSLLLAFLACIVFVLRDILMVGSNKALGTGILPEVFTRLSFWVTAIALSALVFWWKLR